MKSFLFLDILVLHFLIQVEPGRVPSLVCVLKPKIPDFSATIKQFFLYIDDYIKTIHVPLPRKSPIFVNPITHRRTGPFFLISRRPIPENSFWHPNFLNFILRLCAPMKTKSPTFSFTLSQGTFGIHST